MQMHCRCKFKFHCLVFPLLVLILTSLTRDPHSPHDAQCGPGSRGQSNVTRPGPVPAAFREFYYLLVAQFIFGQLTIGHQKSWRIRTSDAQLTITMIRILLCITLVLTLASAVPKPMSDMEIYT